MCFRRLVGVVIVTILVASVAPALVNNVMTTPIHRPAVNVSVTRLVVAVVCSAKSAMTTAPRQLAANAYVILVAAIPVLSMAIFPPVPVILNVSGR